MEAEHCFKYGNDIEAETSNYKIRTTPRVEWCLVVRRNGKTDEDFETICKTDFPAVGLGKDHHNRRIPDIALLRRLRSSMLAKLTREEIIAIVLYTGPLVSPIFLFALAFSFLIALSHRLSCTVKFQWYNTILRQYPRDKYLEFLNGGNLFTTTIFVLVSAVQKMSRAIKLMPGTRLFRGLGGVMDLPARFRKPDEKGCLGYTEWAFMSTTADLEVALKYSGVEQGKPKAMVLVIETGAVDRGACLREYSQYQDEAEFLWLPVSFLQPHGGVSVEFTNKGLVTMVHVRVIPNLKTNTIEEAVEKKKTIHMAAFSFVLEQLNQDLTSKANTAIVQKRFSEGSNLKSTLPGSNRIVEFTVANLIEHIVDECKMTFRRHASLEPIKFVGDETYKSLVTEMLDAQTFAKSKFRLWLEDKALKIMDIMLTPARVAHRDLISFMRRLSMRSKMGLTGSEKMGLNLEMAIELCKLRGLVRDGIYERNEIGEIPFFTAAADGAGPEDLNALISASGVREVRSSVWVAPVRTVHALNWKGHRLCRELERERELERGRERGREGEREREREQEKKFSTLIYGACESAPLG